MITPTENIIETRGLTKRFGARTAVSEVALTVPRGSAFGFLGHNGAGKTTVIRMLLGLTTPSGGEIAVRGRPLPTERRSVLERVGAIVEEPHFHLHLTGRENLRIVAAVRGPAAESQIEPALERVGMTARAGDPVKAYSQGMRQRLGIARCLLADPELLILDEPMNGLDPGGILELRRLIGELVTEGRTVFLSSHLLDEVEKTCDRAAVIDRGRIIAAGTIDEIVGGGPGEIEIGCDDPRLALDLLDGHPSAAAVSESADGLLVVLGPDGDPAGVNAVLVRGGVAVRRLAPVRESLEQRFLELTSTVGGAA